MSNGTSSRYYEQKRKELVEPKKFCACCGKPLHRKFYEANGRWEDWSAFLKRRYCNNSCAAKGVRLEQAKVNEEEFKKNFRPCKELDGLFVDRDGNIVYQGKKKKVLKPTKVSGDKVTAQVRLLVDGRMQYFSVAKLVAHAFKLNYDEDCKISFKDGDIHNVSADNLMIVRRKDYYNAKMKIVSQYRKIGTYQYQVDRLQNVIVEADAVLHYFKTGKMDKVNDHVTKYLYTTLLDWSVKSLHLSVRTASQLVPEVIARMYEVILQGHAISYMERYCKKLLQNKKRKGWWGYEGKIPEKIELIINNLNLDSLCKKYKVTKTRK